MSKRNKLIYWISTLWLSLGMVSSGIVQLLRTEDEVSMFTNLGYPLYLLTLLGVLKIAGVVTLLVPKVPLLKEWTYAGFFFVLSGAVYSHITRGDGFDKYAGPLLLLFLTLVSWYSRSADRKLISSPQIKQHESQG